MVINFINFEKVLPNKLRSLSRGEHSKLSPESINSILEECFMKIKRNERLDISQINTIITFFDKVNDQSKKIFSNYLNLHLGKSELEDEAVLSAFNELFPFEFLKNISDSNFIQLSINDRQKISLKELFWGNYPSIKANPEIIISFINDLKLSRINGFTNGQLRIASPYIKESNFGKMFEEKFERLIEFATNARIDYPSGVARFLDEQLGKRFDEDPDGIRAMAINESLGYYKYIIFAVKNNLPESGLPNLLKLKNIVINLNFAIKTLSEQEPTRGIFWKNMLTNIDGLEIQKLNSTTTYNVAVAFYVNGYVFCDFGPTGNAIHIYRRDVFEEKVKKQKDWKQPENTSNDLNIRKINHTGSWESEMRELIKKARERK